MEGKKQPQKMRRNVIVMIRGGQIECWGSIAEICKKHGFNYHTIIKRKDFPIEQSGWKIYKVPFRQLSEFIESKKSQKDG